MITEGNQAPDFTLISDKGENISLSDYLGKNVLLYFYPKDGTPGCTLESKEFRDLTDDFNKENTEIIGISKDSVESHQKFKKNVNLDFTLLSDPDGKVLDLYGIWKKNSIFGKSFLGTERTSFLINEKGIITKVYRKVKPRGHAQTCLIDLSNTKK